MKRGPQKPLSEFLSDLRGLIWHVQLERGHFIAHRHAWQITRVDVIHSFHAPAGSNILLPRARGAAPGNDDTIQKLGMNELFACLPFGYGEFQMEVAGMDIERLSVSPSIYPENPDEVQLLGELISHQVYHRTGSAATGQ